MNSAGSGAGAAVKRSWAMPAALGLIAAGVAVFLYVLFAAASKPETSTFARLATGAMTRLTVLESPPPQSSASLRDATGAETSLAAYRGEVVLVNLWATWCAPCVQEMPTLAQLQRDFEGRGFRVVTVSIDSEGQAARAQDMLARLGEGSLPFLIDPSRKIVFDANAVGMPTTILYDRQGEEIARVTGDTNWASPEAAAVIEAALAQ